MADISESDTDPFAKFIRKRLRKQFGTILNFRATASQKYEAVAKRARIEGSYYIGLIEGSYLRLIGCVSFSSRLESN